MNLDVVTSSSRTYRGQICQESGAVDSAHGVLPFLRQRRRGSGGGRTAAQRLDEDGRDRRVHDREGRCGGQRGPTGERATQGHSQDHEGDPVHPARTLEVQR
jgi:hypothetical protein